MESTYLMFLIQRNAAVQIHRGSLKSVQGLWNSPVLRIVFAVVMGADGALLTFSQQRKVSSLDSRPVRVGGCRGMGQQRQGVSMLPSGLSVTDGTSPLPHCTPVLFH